MKEHIMNNGIRFINYKMPNTHSITIAIYIRAGLGYEKDNYGISHLLEHLHFRELVDMSQNQLYHKMESMGTTLRGCTYADFIKFSLKIIPCHLREAIQILKSILLTNSWSNEAFDAEKEVVIRQILSSNSYLSLDNEAKRFTLKNSPLEHSIMGELSVVKSFALEQLINHKRESFVADNILFCMTGNFTEDDVCVVKNVIGNIDIPINHKNHWKLDVPNFQNRVDNINVVDCDDDYCDVCLSFDVLHDDDVTYDDLRILNCILGEGVGSRLQQKLREELSLTTDIYSSIDTYADISLLNIKYTIPCALFFESLNAVFNVINNLKSNININDMKTALPFYKDNMLFIQDDTEEMNFQLSYNLFVLGTEYKPSDLECDELSTTRLMNVAKKLFCINNCTITIIGDSKKISKEKIIDSLIQLL